MCRRHSVVTPVPDATPHLTGFFAAFFFDGFAAMRLAVGLRCVGFAATRSAVGLGLAAGLRVTGRGAASRCCVGTGLGLCLQTKHQGFVSLL